jgi:hypothetical protein
LALVAFFTRNDDNFLGERGPAGGLKRCRKKVATAVHQPKGPSRKRSHICAVSIFGGLRARWQSIFQRQAPTHLTRHLLFAVIAYRLQADRFGDLDHATKQVLDRTIAKEAGPAMSSRLASFDQKRTKLTPGTVLIREWDRQSQPVMVMANGFAWNAA